MSRLCNQLSNGCPDKILNEFFIHGRESLLSTVHVMFTVIYSRGYFPKSGSLGDMSLHKKGNKDNVQNYRGITLLNVLGKLFTRILDI